MLVDVDEWGQIDLMHLLLRYARTMLPRPVGDELDPDVKLLLTSVEPVLISRNPAVSIFFFTIIPWLSQPRLHPVVCDGCSESDILCRPS